MNAHEHYLKAEELLQAAAAKPGPGRELKVQAAQVHATLALAAAQGADIPPRAPGLGPFDA